MKGYTFSNGINAYNLLEGLKSEGISLYTLGDDVGLVKRSSGGAEPGDWLFFTEEYSLKRYIQSESQTQSLPNTVATLFVDKYEFLQKVRELGEKPVPYFNLMVDAATLTYPVAIRSQRSWWGEEKAIRGFRCETRESFESTRQHLLSHRYGPSFFFVQQWLGSGVENCFSTSGFFDHLNPHRRIIETTQKMLATKNGFGATFMVKSAVPEVHADLARTTTKLLEAFHYTGPFEMEFLRSDDQYYVLEFNPRFWLQHGIFRTARDNAVIKYYLGRDVFPPAKPPKPVVWVNSTVFAVILNPRFWGFWWEFLRNALPSSQKAIVWDPPIASLPRYAFWWMCRQLQSVRRRLVQNVQAATTLREWV